MSGIDLFNNLKIILFYYVRLIGMKYLEPVVFDRVNPLVSVLVYNYNYGRYLEECLESLCTQTYPNVEVNFSDNASTDHSWEVALEVAKKYPGRITLTRNRKNFGSDANFRNCYVNARGKYFINMCSDDILMPEYVERCVSVLESNPDLGFVMVHRGILDENGCRIDEPPFYNQSCKISGHEQAAVYMLAAVNPSVSQIMYNNLKAANKAATGSFVSRWYGTRILDFNLCAEYEMGYIKEPLLLHRLHGLNDSLTAADNMMEVIGPYVLNHQFADAAEPFDMHKVIERLPASIVKVAKLSLRYCIRAISKNDEVMAKRYYHLSLAMSPEIEQDEIFISLQQYWQAGSEDRIRILDSLHQTDDLVTRTISYDPPPGSQPL